MKQTVFVLLSTFMALLTTAQSSSPTFTNPLRPTGPDPWSIYKDGYYYYTNTTQGNIVIWKTRNLADVDKAAHKTIFTPPEGTAWSKELWAPEIHFIDGKWYVYFAADDGNNDHHRMYVLENASPDPLKGSWTFKGKIADPSDKWAIDGSVFEFKGKWYMVWSGWEADVNTMQSIYIARLKNPWTIDGSRVRISSPVNDWERDGDLPDGTHVNVNEGPQPLINKNKLFLIFSANGCWTDNYCLGMLTFTGTADLLDSTAWQKHPGPVFRRSDENGVYAPGHNSFFVSPNGKENWILYHANAKPGQGCGSFRSTRAQRFSWNEDGTPNFGIPVKNGVPIPIPAEKRKKK